MVVDLSPTWVDGVASGTVTADQATINDIFANPLGYYVNVHSTNYPTGEIRDGWIQGLHPWAQNDTYEVEVERDAAVYPPLP